VQGLPSPKLRWRWYRASSLNSAAWEMPPRSLPRSARVPPAAHPVAALARCSATAGAVPATQSIPRPQAQQGTRSPFRSRQVLMAEKQPLSGDWQVARRRLRSIILRPRLSLDLLPRAARRRIFEEALLAPAQLIALPLGNRQFTVFLGDAVPKIFHKLKPFSATEFEERRKFRTHGRRMICSSLIRRIRRKTRTDSIFKKQSFPKRVSRVRAFHVVSILLAFRPMLALASQPASHLNPTSKDAARHTRATDATPSLVPEVPLSYTRVLPDAPLPA
jgi:hypothetical protein